MVIPTWQLGGAWLSTAKMLKRAADGLLIDYEIAYQQLTNITSSPQNRRSDGTIEIKINDFEIPQDLDLYCPYMLLMGYAVENLIKGIIVCGTGITDPNFDGKMFSPTPF